MLTLDQALEELAKLQASGKVTTKKLMELAAQVSLDTAPVREVIRHGENGLLVDFFEGAQLVASIHKLLIDPTGAQVMRRAAVEAVKERFAQVGGTAGYLDALGLQAGSTATAKPVNEISAEAT